MAELLIPGPASRLLATGSCDGGSGRLIRVLGARQLCQAGVTWAQPTATVFRLGAAVDAAHAVSMVGLALCSRRWRRGAVVEAVMATLFAVAGYASARDASEHLPRAQGVR